MSDSLATLRHKIGIAVDLQSVVRTMKAVAAASVGQYQTSLQSLEDYDRTIELGLGAWFRAGGVKPAADASPGGDAGAIGAIVFGSDQGLVGGFNEVIADHAIATLGALRGTPQVWAVGERVSARLADGGLPVIGNFEVPGSVQAIVPLVGKMELESHDHRVAVGYGRLYVFHNRPTAGSLFEPGSQQLLPLDARWRKKFEAAPWPTRCVPDLQSERTATLRAFIREYLFISLFRACAESLASENASRLAAMERADKNIDNLLEELHGAMHRERQESIDEELFEVIAGYEAQVASRTVK